MYPDLNSKSARLFKAAQEVIPSGYGRHMAVHPPYPIYVDHARGPRVWDVDGQEYLDFTNNFTALIHGHGHAAVTRAIHEQAERILCSTLPSEWEIDLARLLAQRIPSVEQVRFANSGTEAVMIAVKMARALTGRSRIGKLEGGYHGQYDLLEASFQPKPGGWGDPARPNAVTRNKGTPQSLLDEVVILPANDCASSQALLSAHRGELAAVIVDPWRVNLGYIEPQSAYLQMLRDECTRLGILLIFDEVIALRSSIAGRQGQIGVIPDITVMGKIIGGGLPIGAVGARREIMEVFSVDHGAPAVNHSGTFTANPMSLAAGHGAMSALSAHDFARFEALGRRLKTGLERGLADAGIEGRIEGANSAYKVVLTSAPIENWRQLSAFLDRGGAAATYRLQTLLLDEGIIGLRCGYTLSTVMTEADIDLAIAASARAFDRFAREPRSSAA